jgi:hypothetical protein
MRSRAWAVLVAGGLILSASGGRGQDAGPAPILMEGHPGGPDAGFVPAPMEGGPTGGPCSTCAPKRPVRDLVTGLYCKMTEPKDDLCPKGHNLAAWLTYHSEARGFCAWSPCCPPPLYTFFLTPGCDNGAPCGAHGCQEAKGPCNDGHRWKDLIFWRHAAKRPADTAGDLPPGQVAVTAPPPAPHP